jgi:nucleoside-diphosphate-sugar epimerase
MRILITGASGFIGSNLIQHFDGDEVHLVERYVTGRLGKIDRTTFTHLVDLTDASGVKQLVSRIKPEVVVHLAAISPVAYSYDHPIEVLESNLLATANLAESCAALPGFQHMVVAGTTEEYGITKERPATEESKCIPNSPYSVSKYATTEYLMYLYMAKHFPVTVMRSTNTYGRVRDSHFFVERTIRQMLDGKENIILGDPRPVRDFMYVDDHVNGYLKVLENRDKALGQIFNLSTGVSASVEQHAKAIREIIGYKGDIAWNSIAERPLDIQDHRIDSSKAQKVLGWKATVSFEDGVKRTIEAIKSDGKV